MAETPHLFVKLGNSVVLRVEISQAQRHDIAGAFIVAMNNAIDAVAQRYAPNHRGFLLELRERILIGIEPNRLGRGGVYAFVDRVGYRMWTERQADARERARLAAPDQVTEPAGPEQAPLRGDKADRGVR
jgi:hypothetical protein